MQIFQQPVHPSDNPIRDMQFKGLHWIEASAGTGKTYTLSSLMVRVFLQDYLPNQVIATTFTRAAAAELKSRIRARLQETQRYLASCQSLNALDLQEKIRNEQDPLFHKVLTDYALRPDYALNRLKLVIDHLDELFVGTLDSFSQKLLREFAFESGKIERAEITDDAKSYTRQLIHDVLREWIQNQPQPLIDYLCLTQKLKSVEAYVAVVEDTLNFASAQFQQMARPACDLQAFEAQLDALLQLDLERVGELADFYHEAGQYHAVVAKKWRDQQLLQRTLCDDLPAFLQALQQQRGYAVFAAHLAPTLKNLTNLCCGKVLNKCAAEVLQQFEQHIIVQQLRSFCLQVQQLQNDLGLLDSYLKFYISHEVKKRLPQVLQQKGETTFAQQIRTLAGALQGEQGQRFAQYVQARYPLILVDEFQDTNQDQDQMLAQIWRDARRFAHGCMIMVGDPKQAIYGFRGGDMLTYNKARKDVLDKQGHLYTLKYNHRSVAALVEVVDALFQRQMQFGEDVPYTPVQAATRPHPALIDQQGENHAPLRWMSLSESKDELIQVAWKIRDLLNQGIQQQCYFAEKEQPRYLQEDDIAILSRSHDGLDKAQYELERLGIRVNRSSKRSVFDSAVAQDVGALLTAILHPYDEGKIKRALLSRLLGFRLNDLLALENQPDGLSQFFYDFDAIREMWLEKGFLTAWQYCLNLFKVWQTLVAKQSRDNERVVVNLRHLTELLCQHSEHYQGAQMLYHWYLKQLQSPSEREWELERKLSNASGVQLMTIHQSKGLEFKIVFLLGADKKPGNQSKALNFSTVEQVNPITGQAELQRVIAVNDKECLTPEEIAQNEARQEAEQRRLWYVALTRASHRVYAMLHDAKGESRNGLGFWRGPAEQLFSHPYSMLEPLLQERPPLLQASQTQTDSSRLNALALPQQRFYPRSKTSFSALAQHLSRAAILDSLAVDTTLQESAADEIHLPLLDEPEMMQQPIAWIKRHFPMGTNAGSFLHKLFENIRFDDDHSRIAEEVKRRFKNDNQYNSQGLLAELLAKLDSLSASAEQHEQMIYHQMADWLHEVLATPLHADFSLNQLVNGQYLAEFPFYLSLADRVLTIKRIHELYAEYGLDMAEFHQANSARYLTGSIDLVYFDGQRYHIADYKSNFLGADQQDYHPQMIAQNMSHSSYWLQAGLYLVALHRYLRLQLLDYQIERDLGGASYLYLRGMSGQAETGVYHWQPESEFILRLDAILGYGTDVSVHKRVSPAEMLVE